MKCLVELQSYDKAIGSCTAQYKMLLFDAKTVIRELCNFELVCLKKKSNFVRLVTFCLGTSMVSFCTSRSPVGHENTEWYAAIGASKLIVF